MKVKYLLMALSALMLFSATTADAKKKKKVDLWPDGTPVSEWFKQATPATLESLGKQYVLTEHGVKQDSTLVQTEAIQAVIDKAARSGEKTVVVVPQGTFLSGALFMRQGVNLWVAEGGKLKGSDDIKDFPICDTRIEGQSCKYFPALLNVDKIDGITISGKGVVDGNGLRYWRAFWLRRVLGTLSARTRMSSVLACSMCRIVRMWKFLGSLSSTLHSGPLIITSARMCVRSICVFSHQQVL